MPKILLATSTVVAGVALTTYPASALSCIGPEGVMLEATTIFTGRIVDSEDEPGFDTGGRILVEVDEVWKGEAPQRVWLGTELDGWWDMMPGGSIPDGFSSEKIWLFAPRTTDAGEAVSSCSAWDTVKPWGIDLRPANTSVPVGDSKPPSKPPSKPLEEPAGTPGPVVAPEAVGGLNPGPIAGIGTGTVLLVLGARIAWRRRTD